MAKVFKDYEHFVPAVKLRLDMPGANEHVLIRSIDELKEAVAGEHKFVSLDFETSGLNAEEDFIVGFSFAFSSNKGYYVPVNHAVGISLGKETLDILYQLVIKADRVFLYNARFDMRFFEFAGYDLSKMKYFDVMKGIWFADTNVKMPSLKWAERHFLGWDPATFEQTLGDAPNFYHLDPEVAYEYACVDAEGTFALVPTAVKYWKEAKMSGQLDNEILYPLMKWENEGIRIDVDYLNRKIEELTPKLHDLEHEIYSQVGYQFALKSGKQLGDALQSVGINTGEYTKGGQMKTDINTLEALAKRLGEGKESKLLRSIIRYSKLIKLISSFFESLRDEALRMGGRCRFAYIDCNVPCLTADNMVNIKGRGLISIADVESGDYIWTQYGWKEVLWNEKKWSPEVYRVELKNETFIRGTGHHPVLVNLTGKYHYVKPEWSGLSSLDMGERVMVNAHVPEEEFSPKDIEFSQPVYGNRVVLREMPKETSLELIRLMGFVDGDGSIVDDGVKLCFNQYESELIEPYCSLMEGLFGVKRPNKSVGTDHTVQFKYCSVQIRDFFTQIGCKQKSEDRVPRLVREAGPAGWIEYLKGLWDSDGSMIPSNKNGLYEPRVKGNKRGMLWDVFQMAQALGISARFREVSKQDKKPRYEVSARGNRGKAYFRDFIGEGMWASSKRMKAVNNPIGSYYDLEQFAVTKIEKQPGDWVYDIEVADVHEYIANGIVTHNTGRLASGSDKKNMFFAHLNIQAIAKPHPKMWYVHDGSTISDEDLRPGEVRVLDWVFSQDRKSDKWEEGFEQSENIRSAFLPEEGHYWVSIDFNAQELRIPAALSGEPAWVQAFTHGEDPHASTAWAIWGKENYDKDKRKKAKVMNFSCQYGGNKYTVHEKLGIQDLDECEKLVSEWKGGLPTLFAWQDALIRRAKKTGVVYTYFGRPRRVKFYLNSADGKTRAFGVRTVKNSVVQGCGADLTKIGMLKLWKKLLNPELNTGCRFLNTIHDEVNISIPKDPAVFHKYLAIARACMRIKVPGWPFPMETGIEIGDAQGRTWAFNVDDEGNCIPKWEDVPQDEAPPEPEVESTESEDEDEFNIFMS